MMTRRRHSPFWALIPVLFTLLPGAATETIPPLYRAERHFSAGEQYLRALPENTRITIQRSDGTNLVLDLKGGKLVTTLPPSRLSEDQRTLITPLGYQITPGETVKARTRIEAPSGTATSFVVTKKFLIAEESGHRVWTYAIENAFLRLTDGTRIDLLEEGARWDVLTLLGERFSLDPQSRTWSVMPPLPSPPLIPSIPYVYPATGGGVWRIPTVEDHLVFAWNWYPVGIDLGRVIDEVSGGLHRKELNSYFNELGQPQSPADMAGCLLSSRFALGVGDQITFSVPGKEPETVFLVPGVPEASFVLPKYNNKVGKMPLLRQELPHQKNQGSTRLPQ